jgi:hypothetical protein
VIRSLLLSIGGAVLLALPAGAIAAPAPPAGALIGNDAAGNAVAVWTASDGSLQKARQAAGQPWSPAVTLYTPSRFCKFRDKHCTQDRVVPTGLVVNAAGQGFFAIVQTIATQTFHCDRIAAGRVSTRSTNGKIGRLEVHYGECGRNQHNEGSVRDVRTAISRDGSAALAWFHVTPRFPDHDELYVSVYPRLSVFERTETDVEVPRIDSPQPQVGIDDLDRATLVYRDGAAPAVLRSVDVTMGEPAVHELVSPRPGVDAPMLVVDPGGSQTVTYQGAALVGQTWVCGTVSQTRPAAGQPWSAPVLLAT